LPNEAIASGYLLFERHSFSCNQTQVNGMWFNPPHGFQKHLIVADSVVPETFEKAKRVAPGWDVYQLESEWREWIATKGQPGKPGPAFIAFCRKKYQREGMP
jgi:hypothetical protein